MDKLGSPYEYKNPTASEVFDAGDCNIDAMMYYTNASSCTLRYYKGDKVEAKLRLSWCP